MATSKLSHLPEGSLEAVDIDRGLHFLHGAGIQAPERRRVTLQGVSHGILDGWCRSLCRVLGGSPGGLQAGYDEKHRKHPTVTQPFDYGRDSSRRLSASGRACGPALPAVRA